MVVPGQRLLCVHFYQLPLECAFAGGHDAPCAVQIEVRGRPTIFAVSPRARHLGIRPGISVTAAKARHPELEVRVRDETRELERLAAAGELLLGYGSLVEVTPPAFAWVEVGRSGRVLERLLEASGEGAEKKRSPEGQVDRPEDVEGRPAVPGPAKPDRPRLADEGQPAGGQEARVLEHVLRALRRAGHRASIAIAPDPDTARTLAAHLSACERRRAAAHGHGQEYGQAKRAAPRRGISSQSLAPPPGTELDALAALPVEALLWTDPLEDPDGLVQERMHALHAALRVLGIRDVAQLRTLAPAEVASRFGDAGVLLMRRAFAQNLRPLRPFSPAERIIERQELDGRLEDLEPVLFELKRLFDRLEGRLEARGRSARGVVLRFDVEPPATAEVRAEGARSSRRSAEVELAFARPTRRAATMLAMAREKLAGALPGAVRAVLAEAIAPARDRGAQLDLFSTYAQKVEQVGELVGRLVAAFGPEAVFSPTVRDTHRPEAAWGVRPFEIERALEALRAGATRPETAALPIIPEARGHASAEALPEVGGDLLVTAIPEQIETTAEAGALDLEARARAWPKPIARKLEDEPLPPLPPRPLELFASPERATVLHPAPEAALPGVLIWRGERLPLVSISGCERLESEWWTDTPLAREYVIAEVRDGRKLWLFFEPDGELFVHGAFD